MALGGAIAAVAMWGAKQGRDKDGLQRKIEILNEWRIRKLEDEVEFFKALAEEND